MKKTFLFLVVFVSFFPALAEEVVNPTESQVQESTENVFATATYVQGAYDELDNSKQEKLSSENVIQEDGVFVTNVYASNGEITIERTNRVTVPVDSIDSSSRANIWIQ